MKRTQTEERRGSPTILFLIADTGAGHRSAANALCQAMHVVIRAAGHEAGGYHTEVIDAFATCGTLPVRKLGVLYDVAIRYTLWLYGALFDLTNHPWSFQALEWLLYWLIRRGLSRLFTSTRPDLIVSMHPLLNHVSLRVLASLRMRVPVVTVMTDLVTPHRGWVAPAVDACIVPTELASVRCQQQGLPAERIPVLGLPIDLKFIRSGASKATVCRELGLDPTIPIILLAGGGAGAGGMTKMARAVWEAGLPVQLLVVAGHHARLQRRLERLVRHLPEHLQRRCRVLGFVQQMPDLMHAADVLVTKAGPSTICEAIACKLPLLLSGSLPGQEEGNVVYVCEQGIGLRAETPEKLISVLGECLASGSPLLEQMRSNMARLQNPLAAFHIAECILAHLEDASLARPDQTPLAESGKRLLAFAAADADARDIQLATTA